MGYAKNVLKVESMIKVFVFVEIFVRMDRYGLVESVNVILAAISLTIIVKFAQLKEFMTQKHNNAKKFAQNNMNILTVELANASEVIKEIRQENVSLRNAQKMESTVLLMKLVSVIQAIF
jgi:hypothetical protein